MNKLLTDDPAWIIFNKRYHARVRTIETYDIEYLKQYGIYTTGIKEVDRGAALELKEVQLTISEMIEHFSKGFELRIIRGEDILEIYEVIHRHIQDFNDFIDHSINITSVPIEDLTLLSEFASLLYKHIDPEKLQKRVNKPIENPLGEFNFLEESELLVPKKKEVKEKTPLEEISQSFNPPHLHDMMALEEKMKWRRQEWMPIQSR